ncbi:MAG: RNA polymerase sigma factor, partial [Gemmatimonas sp.]
FGRRIASAKKIARPAPPAVPFVHLPVVTSLSADPLPPAPPGEPAWLAPARARTWRYLRYLGCEATLADDFAQDTLLAALRAHGGHEPPPGWLLRTAHNHLRQHHRTQRRTERVLADLELSHAQWTEVAGADDGDDKLAALRACLAELPERSRQVLQQRYGAGLERSAIARALGLGDEGVKSLLVRVRQVLAACMARRVGGATADGPAIGGPEKR